MLSHDFIKGLAREPVFDLGADRAHGKTLSIWVMLMSLHRCTRTSWLGRGRREEEDGGWEPFYIPKNTRTFPKRTLALTLCKGLV